MLALLSAHDLRKTYGRRGARGGEGATAAVDGVDLELAEGEVVVLAGESGSGKSTLARCLLRLIEVDSGTIEFAGSDLLRLSRSELRRKRHQLQMIFQDSLGALDPRFRVGAAVAEALRCSRRDPAAADLDREVERLLERVGLDASLVDRLPHELSGGQRQRVGIARALATNPRLLVADEPVSALDVSIRAQVLNLLLDSCRERGLTLLLILHDLALVDRFADRVLIMFAGKIVERGPSDAVLARPLHPYTLQLLDSVPKIDPRQTLSSPPVGMAQYREAGTASPGCSFVWRCPMARERCRREEPRPRMLGEGRSAACHFAAETGVPRNFLNQSS